MNNTKEKYQYLAEIHLFTLNGTCFAFMPCTLKLFELDHQTYNHLMQLSEKYGTRKPFVCRDEALISSGLIYEADESQHEIFKQTTAAMSREHIANIINPPITNIVLQIANDCNLNCIYCYGDGGSYGRQRELMSLDTAKKAIDYMVTNSEGIDNLLVTFFGGEPLMNFDVVKGALNYCKSIERSTKKTFSFSMTTNGTILTDEIFDFIKDNKVSVMISMDGGEKLQNKHRCYCDGRGSFDDIKKNIERFKEARGGHLTARATVCRTDIRFKEIKDDLLALGFTNAVTSIVDTSEDSPLFVGNEYTDSVLEQYQILADDYVKSTIQGKHVYNNLFSEVLNRLYFKIMKERSCNAGNNGLAIGTDGNLYPCHRFMGMPEYIIGDLEHGINETQRSNYRKATIYEKEDCKNCWCRYLCSGGCAHTAAVHGGDVFHAPECYCDLYKGLYEILLHTYWRLKEWDDDIFRKTLEKSEKAVNTL
ncbi:MAG: radical SAM protein [Ruminococcaceae bacterium]|nr:radical SAM protein [Oscillospiraceae bacterium]